MKELTITLSADLTLIALFEDDEVEIALSDVYKDNLTQCIKEDLGADDCHISNMKIFIQDMKEDTDDEEVSD